MKVRRARKFELIFRRTYDAPIRIESHGLMFVRFVTLVLVFDIPTVFESPFMSMLRSSHLYWTRRCVSPSCVYPIFGIASVSRRPNPLETFSSSHTTNHTGSSASGMAEDRGKSSAA
ncbi:hypothetical protein ACMD2_26334 [Ananas comosus]|uniref:Uncharacterized protein n=1 Tax=Ananas comosus TaxID=4615 RepID=A0A199V304_ANACO|nr:hypothetical protein ACMD2_26334 [Ananas comosus]